MSEPSADDVKAVARQEGSPVLVIGNRVYDASEIIPDVVHFTRKQYIFLQTYRLGISLKEAAEKAGMDEEEAGRFLDRPKTIAWLQDRAVKSHIRNEWHESDLWWQMGHECLAGQRHLSKDQQVVYLEFGKRVCPEVKVAADAQKGPIINFNFGPDAVKEAFRRQAAIDAEITEEAV
jgi:hypothetical protein